MGEDQRVMSVRDVCREAQGEVYACVRMFVCVGVYDERKAPSVVNKHTRICMKGTDVCMKGQGLS